MSRSRNTQDAWLYSNTMRRLSERWHPRRYARKYGVEALSKLQHEVDTLGYLSRGTRKKSQWQKGYDKKRLRTMRYSARKDFITAIEETQDD